MTVTIQRTSKRLKLLRVGGNAVLLLGAALYVLADDDFGLWLAVAGAALLGIARIGSWWNHD